MKGLMAGSLGVVLGLLLPGGRADDVVWRAAKRGRGDDAPVKYPPPHPVVSAGAVAPIPVCVPATPNAVITAAATAEGVTWQRVRAKGDDVPVPSLTPGVPVTGVPPAGNPVAGGPVTSAPVHSVPVVDGTNCAVTSMPGVPCEGMDVPLYAVQCCAPRLQLSAEFLAWWTKPVTDVPLLTGDNLALPVTGSLPGSPVLLSTRDLDDTSRIGFRVGAVYWLDCCASYGLDARLFYTGQTSRDAAFDSGPEGNVTSLFRPFTLASTVVLPTPMGPVILPAGTPFREAVAQQGQATGTFEASSRSRFWGADVNYRDNICCGCDYRLDLLAGFRYLNLDEDLTLVERVTNLQTDSAGFPRGTRRITVDRFATDNDFYGGQVGGVAQFRRGRSTLDVRASVALGVTQQELAIDGSTTLTLPGNAVTVVAPGGLLALNSNIGRYSRDEFSVVPEVGVNLGYQVTDHWKAFVGYNFLYWTNVLRPADQIDTVLDASRIPFFLPNAAVPTTNRPAVPFRDSDFWAHGITAGVEYRW